MGHGERDLSVETILNAPVTQELDNMSDWSTTWSTSQVPGMDTATGGGTRRHKEGRRRLYVGAHVVCCLLAMHVRVTSIALKGSFVVFLMIVVAAVGLLGNPMRHFEVYLGQWSISGPGRAFRIVPMLDGVGIAICINALVRAVTCSVVGATTAIYVFHTISDKQLPFTMCRTKDLDPYVPTSKHVNLLKLDETGETLESAMQFPIRPNESAPNDIFSWENMSETPFKIRRVLYSRHVLVCNETFSGNFPAMYATPPYNYFFFEVMRYDPNFIFKVNVPLLVFIILVWLCVWLYMLVEKWRHTRLIWNNVSTWFIGIPWSWAALVIVISAFAYAAKIFTVGKVFSIGGSRDVLGTITDAFQVALYIHAASLGTEIVQGKGLNHYARGHIDPALNGENVMLSAVVTIFLVAHTTGATICAITDYVQIVSLKEIRETSMWVLPLYSKCILGGNYTHFSSTLLFSGLTFAYVTITVILFKTALHTIFEYYVKLVFVEQYLVGGLILLCMTVSTLFAINTGGLALLEAVDSMMTSIAMPLICTLETFSFLYVYRSSDFVSDMNVATEENVCSARIGIQWQIIPFLCLIIVALKILILTYSEIPVIFMFIAMFPLLTMIVSIPIRACRNAFVYLRPKKK